MQFYIIICTILRWNVLINILNRLNYNFILQPATTFLKVYYNRYVLLVVYYKRDYGTKMTVFEILYQNNINW